MGRLNRFAYRQLIDQDIAWLNEQPRTLEREHIRQVLEWSVDELCGPNTPAPASQPAGEEG